MRRACAALAWTVTAASRGGNGWGTIHVGSTNNGNGNGNGGSSGWRSGSGGGGGSCTITEFSGKAAALKRKHRGRGQYDFARREAEQFLEEEVPWNATNHWIERGNNAIALAQLLNFFEIQPDASLQSLITNKLVRILEDTNYDGTTRLLAAIALAQRGEQHLEKTFAAVEDVLRETRLNSTGGGGGNVSGSIDSAQAWGIIELAAKVLQRGGKHTPGVLGETLAQVAMAQLQRTSTMEMPRFQCALLRVHGWLARIGKVAEANHFLIALVDHTGDFYSYDFSTMMNSCLRHHQISPLPMQLLHRMARAGLMYSTAANGRDVAAIIPSMARILSSLESGKDGVTQRDMGELGGRLNVLLEEYEPRVLRFLDCNDKLHWTHCDDMTSIAFAYEMGGRIRYRHVFVAYQAYVAQQVTRFEPQQLAIASGILRRSHLLSPELAVKLGERIETVLGEFSLSEISHVCATFAPMSPTWMSEAKAVAGRLLTPDCSSYTRLTLAMAFPDDDTLHTPINYKEISTRQLVDSMSLAKGTKLEPLVIGEIIMRLNTVQSSFSPDDIRMLQSSGRQDLEAACGTYLSSRFAEMEWSSDTLYCLPLASGMPHARDPVKVLAAAKAMSISPEQFVSLVELILGVFGTESDEAIVKFVVSGGEELIGAERVQLRTVVRYLEAVRPVQKMHPNAEWIARLNEHFLRHIRNMKVKEAESLLWSLHAVYGNAAQQPLLQKTLTAIVSGPYTQLTQPNEDAAQLTVLIAKMQHGMQQPLLTELATAMVASVRNNAAAYRPDLRMAVMSMSFPREVETKRMGRFTLKAVQATEAAMPPTKPQSQDMNDALDADPFAAPSMPSSIEERANENTGPGYSFFTSPLPSSSSTTTTTTSTITPSAGGVTFSHGAGGASNRVTVDTSRGAAFVDFGLEQRQPGQDSAEIPQERVASSVESSPKQWTLYSNPPGETLEQGARNASTPPTPSSDKNNVPEPRAGSSYMKRFSPGQLFSSRWNKPLQEENIHADDSANKSRYGGMGVEEEEKVVVVMGDEARQQHQQQQPRRTSLPRARAHSPPVGANVITTTTPSFDQMSHKLCHDRWSKPPGVHANLNVPWMSSSGASNGATAPPRVNETERNAFWPSAHIQSPARFFGVVGSGSSSSNNNNSGTSTHMDGTASAATATATTNTTTTAAAAAVASAGYGGGGGGAFAASAQHSLYAQPSNSHMTRLVPPPNRTPTNGGVAAPGNHLFFDPAAGTRSRPVITKKSPAKSAPSPPFDRGTDQVYAQHAHAAGDAASRFMKKNNPSKVAGHNTDSVNEDAGTSGTAKSIGGGAAGSKVFRTVKKRKSLSEWLSAPSAHDVSATRKGRVSPPPAPSPVNGKAKEKGERGKGGDSAVAPMAGATRGVDVAKAKAANPKTTIFKVVKGSSALKTAPKVVAKTVALRVKKLDNNSNNSNNNNSNSNSNNKMAKKKNTTNEKKPLPKKLPVVAAAVLKRTSKKPEMKTKGGKRK